ncbi:Uncharacterised protein [Mycobacteroides abscessus subsp. abscessus]|nr:Uncharacterised protein [Mycobacteroides abscessus subsp. abscessus]
MTARSSGVSFRMTHEPGLVAANLAASRDSVLLGSPHLFSGNRLSLTGLCLLYGPR